MWFPLPNLLLARGRLQTFSCKDVEHAMLKQGHKAVRLCRAGGVLEGSGVDATQRRGHRRDRAGSQAHTEGSSFSTVLLL